MNITCLNKTTTMNNPITNTVAIRNTYCYDVINIISVIANCIHTASIASIPLC